MDQARSTAANAELSRWTVATVRSTSSLPPLQGFPIAAIVQGAMWKAAASVDEDAQPAALAASAHEALMNLVPSCQALIDQSWAESVQSVCRGQVAASAMPHARKVAADRLAMHASRGDIPSSEASWLTAPLLLLGDSSRFMAEAPQTEVQVEEVHEVLQGGGRKAPTRTADQTAAAIFWCSTPSVVRQAVMVAALAAIGEDAAANARVLTCAAAAVADSQVVAWRMKLRSASPRPRLVIHGEAPSRLWPRTLRPDWEPLVESPACAELPSEWCMAMGAGVAVLRKLTGADAIPIDVGCAAVGLLRRFKSFSQMLQESEDARIWAGWHFRSSAVESTEIGLRLGEAIAANPCISASH